MKPTVAKIKDGVTSACYGKCYGRLYHITGISGDLYTGFVQNMTCVGPCYFYKNELDFNIQAKKELI